MGNSGFPVTRSPPPPPPFQSVRFFWSVAFRCGDLSLLTPLMTAGYFFLGLSVLSPISRQECPRLRAALRGDWLTSLDIHTHHRQHIHFGHTDEITWEAGYGPIHKNLYILRRTQPEKASLAFLQEVKTCRFSSAETQNELIV